MAAVYILTVNAVERPLRVDTLDFRTVINGVDVLNCQILSEGGAYRPTLGHVVKLSENGTDVFGGVIVKAEETGADDQPIDDIATEIHCVGYADLFEYAHITETFAIGTTVASIAATLVTNYLSAYGVTLDAGQLTGATLTEEIACDGVLLTDFFDTLLTNTGFAPRINPDKEFILYQPGAAAAAFNVVDGDANHSGDIRVVRSRTKRYNRIIVKYGDNKIVKVNDAFTGNGVLDTFTLRWAIQGPIPYDVNAAVGYAIVNHLGGESIGGASAGLIWEYDPVTLEIVRTLGAVGNAVAFSIDYDVQFPQVTMAEDAADVAANGPYELVVELPTIYDKALAEAQAASILARYLSEPTEVTYPTLTLGLDIGTAQTITAADRNVSGEFLVSEIHTKILGGSQELIRTVKAVGGSTFQGTFRELYIRWLGGGSHATSTAGAVVSTGAGGVPGPPPFSAQYNNNGIFGGADGSDGSVFLRPDGGGPNFGADSLPSAFASEIKNDNIYAATFSNSGLGKAEALTIRPEVSGNVYIEQDGTGALAIFKYGGGPLQFAGGDITIEPESVQFGDFHGFLRNYWKRDAMAVRRTRVTGTTYTIDNEASGGGGIYGAWIFDTTAACTVTLPSVSAFMGLPSTGYGRVLEIRNDSALYVVTLDGASSELIFRGSTGRLTFPLMPGASIKLIAKDSTGAGWKVLSYDQPPLEKTFTDAQIKALPTNASGLELVPAPGSGFYIRWTEIELIDNFAAGAYTNVNATYSDLNVATGSGGLYGLGPVNDSTTTPNLTQMERWRAAASRRVRIVPFLNNVAHSSGENYVLTALADGTVGIDAVTIFDNLALKLWANNNGSGDYTGGHASNTKLARTHYSLEAAA